MKTLFVKFGVALVATAALGLAAAPASAQGLPLEQAPEAEQVFAPETGSAGIYNNAMCMLHTISASVPCMYT
ncbi:hypothetical protein [Nocardia sp. XZ_19_385]|uniref:hypothetical protein n=1 Tax=Nocardia sp. XZ_19_385 TaxID=2769488 RepID=UPI00188FAAC6|nr:hypothetical protein [Nocardia sp. XZ_19_385]